MKKEKKSKNRISLMLLPLITPLLLYITCINDEESYRDCMEACNAEYRVCIDSCNEVSDADGKDICLDKCEDYNESCCDRCN